MGRHPRLHVPGATYHVIARGNERRLIFRDDADHAKYLSLLRDAAHELEATVLAYCLMSNHVHLVVRSGQEPLSAFMKGVHAAFARYFNKRHKRTGHLFEGRYRAILVDQDSYLLSVIRYVHLNPVKAGLVSTPERYRWCSHAEYVRGTKGWLSTSEAMEFFEPRRDARRRFHEFVTGKAGEDVPPYSPEEAALGALVGPEAFRRKTLREAGQRRLFPKTLKLERIVRVVAEAEGVSVDELMDASRARGPSRVRAMCATLARDLSGIPIAETARYFGRDGSTLWRNVIYFEEHVDEATERRLKGLRKELLG